MQKKDTSQKLIEHDDDEYDGSQSLPRSKSIKQVQFAKKDQVHQFQSDELNQSSLIKSRSVTMIPKSGIKDNLQEKFKKKFKDIYPLQDDVNYTKKHCLKKDKFDSYYGHKILAMEVDIHRNMCYSFEFRDKSELQAKHNFHLIAYCLDTGKPVDCYRLKNLLINSQALAKPLQSPEDAMNFNYENFHISHVKVSMSLSPQNDKLAIFYSDEKNANITIHNLSVIDQYCKIVKNEQQKLSTFPEQSEEYTKQMYKVDQLNRKCQNLSLDYQFNHCFNKAFRKNDVRFSKDAAHTCRWVNDPNTFVLLIVYVLDEHYTKIRIHYEEQFDQIKGNMYLQTPKVINRVPLIGLKTLPLNFKSDESNQHIRIEQFYQQKSKYQNDQRRIVCFVDGFNAIFLNHQKNWTFSILPASMHTKAKDFQIKKVSEDRIFLRYVDETGHICVKAYKLNWKLFHEQKFDKSSFFIEEFSVQQEKEIKSLYDMAYHDFQENYVPIYYRNSKNGNCFVRYRSTILDQISFQRLRPVEGDNVYFSLSGNLLLSYQRNEKWFYVEKMKTHTPIYQQKEISQMDSVKTVIASNTEWMARVVNKKQVLISNSVDYFSTRRLIDLSHFSQIYAMTLTQSNMLAIICYKRTHRDNKNHNVDVPGLYAVVYQLHEDSQYFGFQYSLKLDTQESHDDLVIDSVRVDEQDDKLTVVYFNKKNVIFRHQVNNPSDQVSINDNDVSPVQTIQITPDLQQGQSIQNLQLNKDYTLAIIKITDQYSPQQLSYCLYNLQNQKYEILDDKVLREIYSDSSDESEGEDDSSDQKSMSALTQVEFDTEYPEVINSLVKQTKGNESTFMVYQTNSKRLFERSRTTYKNDKGLIIQESHYQEGKQDANPQDKESDSLPLTKFIQMKSNQFILLHQTQTSFSFKLYNQLAYYIEPEKEKENKKNQRFYFYNTNVCLENKETKAKSYHTHILSGNQLLVIKRYENSEVQNLQIVSLNNGKEQLLTSLLRSEKYEIDENQSRDIDTCTIKQLIDQTSSNQTNKTKNQASSDQASQKQNQTISEKMLPYRQVYCVNDIEDSKKHQLPEKIVEKFNKRLRMSVAFSKDSQKQINIIPLIDICPIQQRKGVFLSPQIHFDELSSEVTITYSGPERHKTTDKNDLNRVNLIQKEQFSINFMSQQHRLHYIQVINRILDNKIENYKEIFKHENFDFLLKPTFELNGQNVIHLMNRNPQALKVIYKQISNKRGNYDQKSYLGKLLNQNDLIFKDLHGWSPIDMTLKNMDKAQSDVDKQKSLQIFLTQLHERQNKPQYSYLINNKVLQILKYDPEHLSKVLNSNVITLKLEGPLMDNHLKQKDKELSWPISFQDVLQIETSKPEVLQSKDDTEKSWYSTSWDYICKHWHQLIEQIEKCAGIEKPPEDKDKDKVGNKQVFYETYTIEDFSQPSMLEKMLESKHIDQFMFKCKGVQRLEKYKQGLIEEVNVINLRLFFYVLTCLVFNCIFLVYDLSNRSYWLWINIALQVVVFYILSKLVYEEGWMKGANWLVYMTYAFAVYYQQVTYWEVWCYGMYGFMYLKLGIKLTDCLQNFKQSKFQQDVFWKLLCNLRPLVIQFTIMTVASSFCFWCMKVDFTSDDTRCEDLQGLNQALKCLTYFTFYIFSQRDECFPVVGLPGNFIELDSNFPDYQQFYNGMTLCYINLYVFLCSALLFNYTIALVTYFLKDQHLHRENEFSKMTWKSIIEEQSKLDIKNKASLYNLITGKLGMIFDLILKPMGLQFKLELEKLKDSGRPINPETLIFRYRELDISEKDEEKQIMKDGLQIDTYTQIEKMKVDLLDGFKHDVEQVQRETQNYMDQKIQKLEDTVDFLKREAEKNNSLILQELQQLNQVRLMNGISGGNVAAGNKITETIHTEQIRTASQTQQ